MPRRVSEGKKANWRLIIGVVLFVTLLFSIGYALINYFGAPEQAQEGVKSRSDYALMLTQCLLGVVVMFLPSIIQKKWSVAIPNYMYVCYFVFLYCAIYLGEVRNFYYLIPNWDTILHGFSGAMLGALGFSLVSMLNKEPRIQMQLSPVFVALFAFCFALAAGVAWEIYEYTFDGAMGLNMQKFALESGVQLVGREALQDTMEDLITDAVGAFIPCAIGFLLLRRQRKREQRAESVEE